MSHFIAPNENAQYVFSATQKDFGGVVVEIPAPRTSYARMSDFLTDRLGYDDVGNYNKTDSDIFNYVISLLKDHAAIDGIIMVVGMGSYSPCIHKVKTVEPHATAIFTIHSQIERVLGRSISPLPDIDPSLSMAFYDDVNILISRTKIGLDAAALINTMVCADGDSHTEFNEVEVQEIAFTAYCAMSE